MQCNVILFIISQSPYDYRQFRNRQISSNICETFEKVALSQHEKYIEQVVQTFRLRSHHSKTPVVRMWRSVKIRNVNNAMVNH